MVCPFCREEIQEGAIKCKHCSSVLVSIGTEGKEVKERASTKSILSMVFGLIVLVLVISISDPQWDHDTAVGIFMLSLPSVVLGGICLAQNEKGRAFAITGIALGTIAILSSLDHL